MILVAEHTHDPLHSQRPLKGQDFPLLHFLCGVQTAKSALNELSQLRAAFRIVRAIEENASVTVAYPLNAPGPPHPPDAFHQGVLGDRCTHSKKGKWKALAEG
jgi:hypothetical protein